MKTLQSLLDVLETVRRTHPGLDPELARAHLLGSPAADARAYAEALNEAAGKLQLAIDVAARMIELTREPRVRLVPRPGDGS